MENVAKLAKSSQSGKKYLHIYTYLCSQNIIHENKIFFILDSLKSVTKEYSKNQC